MKTAEQIVSTCYCGPVCIH